MNKALILEYTPKVRETEKLLLFWLHKEYGMYDFLYENWGVKKILYGWVVKNIVDVKNMTSVGFKKIGVKTIYNCVKYKINSK